MYILTHMFITQRGWKWSASEVTRPPALVTGGSKSLDIVEELARRHGTTYTAEQVMDFLMEAP